MEEQILNWTILAGILTSLGVIIKIVFDNRSLSSGQKELKKQSQRLKDELAIDHKELLESGKSTNMSLAVLDTKMDFVKTSIETSNRRLESLNSSEREAQVATDVLVKYLSDSQRERQMLEKRCQDLELGVKDAQAETLRLKQENEALRQEMSTLRRANQPSKRKVRSLDFPSGPRL